MKRLFLLAICFLTMLCLDAQVKYVVTSSSLNVRQYPSAESPLLGKLPLGTTIDVWWIMDGWAKIMYQQKHAYVSEQYIAEATSPAALAAIQKASQIASAGSNTQSTSKPSSPKPSEVATVTTTSSTANKSSSTSKASSPQETKKTTTPKEVAKSNNPESTSQSKSAQQDNSSKKEESSQPVSKPTNGLGIYGELFGVIVPKNPICGGFGGDVQFGLNSYNINFIGVGVGIRGLWSTEPDKFKTVKYSQAYMPIYVNDKIYFSKGETAPYIDIALGGVVTFKQTIKTISKTTTGGTSTTIDKYDGGGGLFLRAGIGITHRGSHFGLGYEMLGLKVKGFSDLQLSHCIYLKIGFGNR